jgi:hypothetical protein
VAALQFIGQADQFRMFRAAGNKLLLFSHRHQLTVSPPEMVGEPLIDDLKLAQDFLLSGNRQSSLLRGIGR